MQEIEPLLERLVVLFGRRALSDERADEAFSSSTEASLGGSCGDSRLSCPALCLDLLIGDGDQRGRRE